MTQLVPAFIGGLGPLELAILFAVLVLLFGASKIPDLARSMGLAMGEFEKGREQVEQELAEMREDDDSADDTPAESETAEPETADEDGA